jgi:hypothetical protein
MKNKNRQILDDFVHYCVLHPEQRFWQALRNWSGFSFVGVKGIVIDGNEWHDTFYFEGKDK